MKLFKNLFIKDESEQEEPKDKEQEEKLAFPVSSSHPESHQPNVIPATGANQYLTEIIEVYEKGLESINMPGYDFYDFYLAVKASGVENEAVYKMAYQMGKTMDKNITPAKLSSDAEYYISKLNEVYRTYSEKGSQKLSSLEHDLKTEKDKMALEANGMESDIHKMRQEIMALEQRLMDVRSNLARVDGKYKPQQDVIKLKLEANEHAMKISVQKLNTVKESIMKFIK
jgi:hypothetical protein